MQHDCEAEKTKKHKELEKSFCFPGGKRKCLVMSYDDGSEHDRRLVELFNQYGLKGTFHLNSGKLGLAHHVGRQEIATLYDGHEISCHTVDHRKLTQLSDDEVCREIRTDKEVLEDLSGSVVRGLAYPFGDYDSRIVSLLSTLGIEYARTIQTTQRFVLPPKLLELTTTCHHNQVMELGQQFLATDAQTVQLMVVWGHSYELDGFMSAEQDKNWQYMAEFCRMMQGGDIHFATLIEVVDLIKDAARREALSGSEVDPI